ncbi:hypothetical protein PR002_g18388 [Phytophthora rubi]|uniref:Reverse transcriptase Ty1/copia-type domain-containing protein n=1 Tax=Phytophthora rubi TaxID=129364 RepID=A0A6A3K2A9_9STRA|nr:hypothetical protein PR002_g18388 [Phytophthora rubi]
MTLAEARRSPLWPLWKRAIEEEIEALRANDTFDVVEPPPDAHIVGSTVKFRVKRDGSCNIDRLRARLCAQGFSQIFLVDYGETYAPVARLVSVRVFLALVTHHGLRVCQCDVPSAYVKARLDTVIYMRQLPGFEIGGRGMVWRLKKALYSLKQAGKEWYDEIDAFFTAQGLVATREDKCVYKLPDSSIIVLLYVDDILIGYSDEGEMTKLVDALKDKYDVKCLGDVSWFLGMRIKVDVKTGTTSIDQYQFAKEVLRRFEMESCKPAHLPLNSGTFLVQGDEDDLLSDHVPYRAAVGALLYLSRVSRPDLAFAVNQVAAHASKPKVFHWTAVKQILRYIAGTTDMTLIYRRQEDGTPVELFSDADWANNTEDRKSISGVLVKVHGNAVSWITRRQTVVAKSSTAAEFIAASIGIEEARWVRMLMQTLMDKPLPAIQAHIDNQSTIAQIVNGRSSDAQKTIDCMFFDMKDAHKRGEVNIGYCPTEIMTADGLTKALGRQRFNLLQGLVGLRSSNGPRATVPAGLESSPTPN